MAARRIVEARVSLSLLAGVGLVALTGCAAEDYAREEGFVPQSAAEYRAERLLNDFSDDLDDEDFAAACEKMTPVLQLRYAISTGRRDEGCEIAMQDVARAGSLGSLEIEGIESGKRGSWVDVGEAEFLIRRDHIANLRQ